MNVEEKGSMKMTLKQINDYFNQLTNISTESKLRSSTYYACMQIRCNAVAKLPIKLIQDTENGKIKAVNHELYYLLKKRPNRHTTPHDFLWATEFQRLEYGNAFWYIRTERGKRAGLYLLDSRRVTIFQDDTGLLTEEYSVCYKYDDEKYGEQIYSTDEIVHFKNFSKNGIKGTGIKEHLSDIIDNEMYSTNVLKTKYKNGLQDPVIVQYIGDLNDAMQTKIINKFKKLGGAKNAGKVIPIPTDFKVEQLETNLVNSQFFELQGLTTRGIANAFGVKSFQLNDMEKSTYSNIEQQNAAFYSDTLQNVLTTYEQEMDYKLLTTEEQRKLYFVKFSVDCILRSDLETRTKSYQTGIASGYISVAEVREWEDLPYIEGTDELIIGNGASIPLKDLGKQYAKGDEFDEDI